MRLGKFRRTNDGRKVAGMEVGETSNSNLDAIMCYSMESYQYVVAKTELQVALQPGKSRGPSPELNLNYLKLATLIFFFIL